MHIFRNRQQAGQMLAELLLDYKDEPHALVLALPRGGVPIGYEIAKKLHLPLDIWLVRKLGIPGNEELAMGAIALADTIIINDYIVKELNIDKHYIKEAIAKEKKVLLQRNALYRQNRDLPDLKGRTVIVADDGLATGATMRVAAIAINKFNPDSLIAAIPIADQAAYKIVAREVDKLVCINNVVFLSSVGSWYEDFSQTTDNEVINLLKRN